VNFFEHQDQARRNTRLLLLLFALAVFCLVFISNLLIIFVPFEFNTDPLLNQGKIYLPTCYSDETCVIWDNIPWRNMFYISAVILGGVFFGAWWRSFQLRAGGQAVAQMMGGSEVDHNTDDYLEKRFVNVAHEMALAANTTMPSLYVMKDEPGLNAFAAGFSHKDAVIAVTQGLLDETNRDQLQSVIAHEFSHIIHGDARLNMRLLAIINGIEFIADAGYVLMRASGFGSYGYGRGSLFSSRSNSRNSKEEAGFALAAFGAGLAMVVLGYLGVFFGSLIKAAVSREREYLADASAVKYTRNGDAVADALKVILHQGGNSKGSYLSNGHSAELSHFFFAKPVSMLRSVFATHPPLVDRIYRVQPNWDGNTLVKSKVADVRRKAAEHAAAKKAEAAADEQQMFDMEASPLVAALMVADQLEEAILAKKQQAASGLSLAPLEDDSAALVNTNDDAKFIQSIKPLFANPVCAAALILQMLIEQQFEDDSLLSAGQSVEQERKKLQALVSKHWPEIKEQWVKVGGLKLSERDVLLLVDLALPSLKALRKDEYALFKKLLIAIIKRDQEITIQEWCIYHLIDAGLEAHFNFKKEKDSKYNKAQAIELPLTTLLHVFIQATSQSEQDKNAALAKAMNTLGLYNAPTSLDWHKAPSLDDLKLAINEINLAYSLLKAKIMQALADASKHDGIIEKNEQQLITTIAAIIGVPMPNSMVDELSLMQI